MEKNLVNTKVIIVSQEMPINEVVQKMVEAKISSVLVHDEKDMVVGIITERDIVHKFTLLEVEDKLTRKAMVIMTRPPVFVSEKNLMAEIKQKHLEMKIRHFPVLRGKEPKLKNIIGIVSVTDVLRHLLTRDSGGLGEKSTAARPSIAVVTTAAKSLQTEIDALRKLNFTVTEVMDMNTIVREHGIDKMPVIFDGDGYSQQQLTKLVPVIRKYRATLLFLTNNPSLAQAFRKMVSTETGHVQLKPLDVDYWEFLMTKRT